ncbi:MAG: hypothetical protein WDM85_03350 [Caulobacteraceae bacterium]
MWLSIEPSGSRIAEGGVGGVIGRAEIDPRHVLHPGDTAGGVALDDDVAELLRRGQPGQGCRC